MNKTGKQALFTVIYLLLLYIGYSFFLGEKELFLSVVLDFFIHMGVFLLIQKLIIPKVYGKYPIEVFIGMVICIILMAPALTLYDLYIFPEDFTNDDLITSRSLSNMVEWRKHYSIQLPLISLLGLIASIVGISQFHESVREKATLELKAENKYLNYQINPHFLFNALNNIYSTSILQPDSVSQSIYELSELLSYTLYSSEKNKVSLEEEIVHIKHFINMMKLKDSSLDNITFEYENVDTSLKISPMILIPFIENAFKHGNISVSEEGWIKVKMNSKRGVFFFQCQNSVGPTKKNKDKLGGIGIANVKRRLEIIYPNKHQLSTTPLNTTYAVELNLELT